MKELSKISIRPKRMQAWTEARSKNHSGRPESSSMKKPKKSFAELPRIVKSWTRNLISSRGALARRWTRERKR